MLLTGKPKFFLTKKVVFHLFSLVFYISWHHEVQQSIKSKRQDNPDKKRTPVFITTTTILGPRF